MILKIGRAQPIFDKYRQHPQKFKDRLKRKKNISFANDLENIIRSKSTGS
jgi:hypothetical protein